MTDIDTITVTINGITYDEIVPRDYFFNPNTEDLIYANELVEGMIVLSEADLVDNTRHEFNSLTIVKNRWCTVSKLRSEDDPITFIGVYADGTKASRQSMLPTHCWIVKKDSIPAKKDVDSLV